MQAGDSAPAIAAGLFAGPNMRGVRLEPPAAPSAPSAPSATS